MKYQLATRKVSLFRIECYLGVIIDLETKTIVLLTTAMSETGVSQILNTKLRKFVNDDAKGQKAPPKRSDS